jgi:hypothetical protein
MEFVLSSKFIVGALIGALLYHLWMVKAHKQGGK